MQKLDRIPQHVLDFITENRLNMLLPSKVSRRDFEESLLELSRVAYYAPQISFLIAHICFSYHISCAYFDDVPSGQIIVPAILEPTSHVVGITTTIFDAGPYYVIKGVKILPYFHESSMIATVARTHRNFVILLLDKSLIRKSAYIFEMEGLSTTLCHIIFPETIAIENIKSITIDRERLLRLLKLFLLLLDSHLMGVMKRFLDSMEGWWNHEEDKHLEIPLEDVTRKSIPLSQEFFRAL